MSDKLPVPYNADANLNGYIGYDISKSEECGFSVFRLNGYTMEIVDVITDCDDETAEGFIRRALAANLNMRNTPKLTFIADNSIEHSAEINKKLRELLPEDED